nr:MAG TPA: hypothetical protein [Caudoviricetes sp.]
MFISLKNHKKDFVLNELILHKNQTLFPVNKFFYDTSNFYKI